MVSVKEHFHLTASPFSKDIPADKIYRYGQLEQLFANLAATVEDCSMALITGRAGTGKTTALRTYLELLPSARHKVIYLGQDQRSSGLMARLSAALGLRTNCISGKRLLQITNRLETESMHRRLILVVDEAHALEQPTLEDIRFLTNQDMDRRSPVTVFMIGQHWLRNMLKKQGHEALWQRMRLRFSLEGLTEEETAEYIRHHMCLVGCQKDVFEPKAIAMIFNASDGILREINNLAFECLLKAALSGRRTVDERLATRVINERELS